MKNRRSSVETKFILSFCHLFDFDKRSRMSEKVVGTERGLPLKIDIDFKDRYYTVELKALNLKVISYDLEV